MHYELDKSRDIDMLQNHEFVSLVKLQTYSPWSLQEHAAPTYSVNGWPVVPIVTLGPKNPTTLETPVLFRLVDHEPIDVKM